MASDLNRRAIEFLIRLSESNARDLVITASTGELLNVSADLCRLIRRPGYGGKSGTLAQEAAKLTEEFRADIEGLATLIKDLNEFLTAFAEGCELGISLVPGSKLVFAERAPNSARWWINSPGTRHGLIQSVLSAAGFVLIALGDEASMVRRCARETCRRVFLAKRPKQIFHDHRCAAAVSFDRYREKLEETLGQEGYRAKRSKTATASQRKRVKQSARRDLSPTRKALAGRCSR